jgi:hypothetical protein
MRYPISRLACSTKEIIKSEEKYAVITNYHKQNGRHHKQTNMMSKFRQNLDLQMELGCDSNGQMEGLGI